MRNYESIQTILSKFETGVLRIEEGRVFKNGVEVSVVGRGEGHYRTLDIRIEGKRCRSYLHNIVYALAHGIEELKRHETIDHLDGDKFNNALDNLEGCSNEENTRRFHDHPDRVEIRLKKKAETSERRELKKAADATRKAVLAEKVEASRLRRGEFLRIKKRKGGKGVEQRKKSKV